MTKQTDEHASKAMTAEWFEWLAGNVPLETERMLRTYKLFAVTNGNMWYEVWTYPGEAAHYVTLHARCGGHPAHYTNAGHESVNEASKWAVDLAEQIMETED